VSDWMSLEAADPPEDVIVEVKTQYGDRFIATHGYKDDHWMWCADPDDCPANWLDGVCWESSDKVTAFRRLDK